MNGQKLWNRWVARLLRSRYHRLLSKSTLLITFTGCKSGKTYTTPVNYLPDGKTLLVLSRKDRTWWKNLRGGASVTVRIQGEDRKAMGKAFEDPKAIAEGLLQSLQRIPRVRKHFKIALTREGQPEDAEAFARVVQSRVIVRITDLGPCNAP